VAIPAGQMERRVPEDVDMAPWIRLDQFRVGSDQELHCLKPATQNYRKDLQLNTSEHIPL
jgi:hypothetical protein